MRRTIGVSCVLGLALVVAGCAGAQSSAGAAAGAAGSRELTPWESSFGISSAADAPLTVTQPDELVVLSESTPIADGLTCDGVTRDENAVLPLPVGSTATSVVLCNGSRGYLPGSGYWSTVESRLVPVESMPELASRFHAAIDFGRVAHGERCSELGE